MIKAKRERRHPEYQSETPPEVKILFYSVTRIEGVRKCVKMNDPDQEES